MLGCAAAALFVLALYRHRAFLHDDALISLRFARHFTDHGALEWNLGERVEGYTNFLHLVLTAGLMTIGIDPIDAVRAVNFAATAGLFWATWRGLRTLLPAAEDDVLRAAGMFLVAAIPAIPLWILGGLETVMAAALTTAGVALLLPALVANSTVAARPICAGLAMGAAILTRPDAAVAAGAFLIMVLILLERPWAERLTLVLVAGISVALPVLLHAAWRYSYYGDLLPNTFYAKVGVPLGLRLGNGAQHFMRSFLMVPAIAGSLILLLLIWRRSIVPKVVWALLVPCMVHLGYVLWAGGDHMAGARLLLPIASIAAFLAVVLVKAYSGTERTFGLAGLLVFAVMISAVFPGQRTDESAFTGRIVGEHLARSEKPGTLVATATAGSIPYYADQLRFIDTLGLVDATIARRREFPLLTYLQMTMPGHTKGDGAYVLARQPDIIILGPGAGVDAESPIHFLSDREAVNLPEFKRCYRLHREQLPYDGTRMSGRSDIPNPLIFTYFRRICPTT